jgi:D-alanyl-D-alanine dipeptidase
MQGLIELASQLRTLKEKEARLKNELSNTRIQIKNIKKDLVNQMINYEVQNFKHNDNIFYLTTNIYVSDVASRREELYSTLRDNGYGSLIKETVHPQTLKAFVKELMAENGDEVPEWLNGLVTVYEEQEARMKKA